jgi:hypothetical protein
LLDGGELGMERRENEAAAEREAVEELPEQVGQPCEMFTHERVENRVEDATMDRQSIVEVGLGQGHRGILASGHAEHPARQVQADGSALCEEHRTEMHARAAPGVEHRLRRLRIEQGDGVTPVERDEWVRNRVVRLGPQVVALTNSWSINSLAHGSLAA